jgi:hypothetical protein
MRPFLAPAGRGAIAWRRHETPVRRSRAPAAYRAASTAAGCERGWDLRPILPALRAPRASPGRPSETHFDLRGGVLFVLFQRNFMRRKADGFSRPPVSWNGRAARPSTRGARPARNLLRSSSLETPASSGFCRWNSFKCSCSASNLAGDPSGIEQPELRGFEHGERRSGRRFRRSASSRPVRATSSGIPIP